MKLGSVAVTLIAALVVAGPVDADPVLMVIEGTVTDPIGRLLENVTVTDNRSKSDTTDSMGYYRIEEHALSTYVVSVTRQGLAPQSKTVDPITARDPVDFTPSYSLSGSVSPSIFNINSVQTISVSARSYAPTSGQCISFTDSSSGSIVALTWQSDYADGSGLWVGSYEVPSDRVDGGYFYMIDSLDCSSSISLATPVSSSYRIDSVAPSFSDPSPTGWTFSPDRLQVKVFDLQGSGVKPSTIAWELDGIQVPTTSFNPSSGLAIANVSGVGEGAHQVEVSASDYAGNVTSVSSSFTVENHPPDLAEPAPQGVITTSSPAISITASDTESGVGSFRMILSNGLLSNQLDASYDPTTGRISYQVPSSFVGTGLGEFPLVDGPYSVEVTVWDNAGNPSAHSWVFIVDTIPI